MINQILNKDEIMAIHIPREYESNGIEFFTPSHFSQQLAYMKRPAKYKIKPHLHNTIKREVFNIDE